MSASTDNFEDKFFGPLKWDEEYEWFLGNVKFASNESVEITLVPKSKGEIELFARKTEKLFAELQQNFGAIYVEMRKEYLKLYNESWAEGVNGYGEPTGRGKISTDQFNDYVGLESIWFESDGSVELFFYDNDKLFGGHSIHVRLGQKLNLKGTGLEG